ncbi:predicted ORF [Xanthomonas phage XacN1]|nr:predicted ORF [Xanthomonas phage XacN1]
MNIYLYDHLDREDFHVMWHRFRRLLTHMGFNMSWASDSGRQVYETKTRTFGDTEYKFETWNEQGLMDIDTMKFSTGDYHFHVSNQEQCVDVELRRECRNNEVFPIMPYRDEAEFISEFHEFLDDYLPE